MTNDDGRPIRWHDREEDRRQKEGLDPADSRAFLLNMAEATWINAMQKEREKRAT